MVGQSRSTHNTNTANTTTVEHYDNPFRNLESSNDVTDECRQHDVRLEERGLFNFGLEEGHGFYFGLTGFGVGAQLWLVECQGSSSLTEPCQQKESRENGP